MSRRRMPAGEPTEGPPADLLPDADPEQVARTILLRKLTASPRTRSQLRQDLLGRGVPEDVSDRVLDRFEEVGLVDDAEYARMWVSSRQRTRGSARSVMRQELRLKGVDDELIAEALGEVTADDELAGARMLVERKWSSVSRLEPDVRKRRLLAMLQRRGHSMSTALAAISEAEAAVAG